MRPGFLASISATRGATSRATKSSAVSFIIRCSSESISGVKMVTDPVGSSRKPPPGERVMPGVDVAGVLGLAAGAFEGAAMLTGYQLAALEARPQPAAPLNFSAQGPSSAGR